MSEPHWWEFENQNKPIILEAVGADLTASTLLLSPSPSDTPESAQNVARQTQFGRFWCRRCGQRWNSLKYEHCTMCCQTFSGTTTGDMHRTGEHGVKEDPDRRRCLTVEEMLALRTKTGKPRLKLNDRGVWVTWSDGQWRGPQIGGEGA